MFFMVILGIDPGYATVGYGVIKTENGRFLAVDYGAITTSKEISLTKRLEMIADGIEGLIDKYKPDAFALEELFFQNNQKTAIAVAEARGVILLAAVKKMGEIFEYTPMQVKQALTGYGRADKTQMQQVVKLFLGLKEIPKPDDAADALAIALTHAQTGRLSGQFKI